MKIAQKIAKILEIARTTKNEGEASVMLAKAQALMEEHQLSFADVTSAEDPIDMATGLVVGSGPMVYKQRVQAKVAIYFGCRCILVPAPGKKLALKIVGSESSRVTAALMFDYIWDTLKRLAKEQAQEFGVDAAAQLRSLASAMVDRLGEEMKQRREAAKASQALGLALTGDASRALVLKDAVQAKYDELFPRRQSATFKTRNINDAAREGAAGISLNKQAGNSGATLRIGRK